MANIIRQCIAQFISDRVEYERLQQNSKEFGEKWGPDDPRMKEREKALTYEILEMEEEIRALFDEVETDLRNTGNIPRIVRDMLTKQYEDNLIGRSKINKRKLLISELRKTELRGKLYRLASELDVLSGGNSGEKLKELDDAIRREPSEIVRNKLKRQYDIEKKNLHKQFPEAAQAILVGSEKNLTGGKASLDATTNAIEKQYTGGLMNELNKSGLLELFLKDDLQKEVAIELNNYTYRDKADGKIKINPKQTTNSKEARDIAEVIYKYQHSLMLRRNRAGNYVKELPGYITRQSHDIFMLRKVGRDTWVNDVLDMGWLDINKTFRGLEANEIKPALEAVYDNIVAGNMRFGDFRASAPHRELHFRDASSFIDYNNKYGSKSLSSSIQMNFKRGAREVGLTELLGPNPREVMDDFFVNMNEMSTDPDVANYWNERIRRKIDNQYKEFDGTTRTPADNILSNKARGFRAWQNVTKLGSAVLSAVADIPFQASELRHQGDNLLKAYYKGFENIFKGKGKGTRKEVANLVGVGLESMLGEVLARYSPIDALPGWINRAQQKFFKYSGLELWTDAHKTGVANMMAHRMAQMKDLPFDKIDKDLNRLLGNYGIDATKWELIRKTAVEMDDGRLYITPDGIRDLSDNDILAVLPDYRKAEPRGLKTVITDYKDKLETELRSFFLDRIDYAVITPGAKQRAFMLQGTTPGTYLGEALRAFWQFKSFPLTAIQKVWNRELHGKGGVDVGGMAHLLIGTTILGYGAMTLKDISKGRTPRELFEDGKPKGKVWAAAFVQGGGAGILGDFLLGSQTRYGQSKLESFMGPSYGTVSQALKFATEDTYKFMSGEKDADAYSTSAVNIIKQNVPFINMWYSKWAVDYMMLYAIQEEINPGYFRRMNRRLDKEYGQTSFLEPGLGLY